MWDEEMREKEERDQFQQYGDVIFRNNHYVSAYVREW